MTVSPIDCHELLTLALEAARAGGEVLLGARRELAARAASRRTAEASVETKGVRRELVTATDRAAERAVVGRILAARPQDGVLAEEGELTPKGEISQDAEVLWIVDPLDGTTNFVHGLPFFSVAVAAYAGKLPLVGVVLAPDLGRTWYAAAGLGAFHQSATDDPTPIRVSPTSELADALLATGFSYVRNEPGRDTNVGRIGMVIGECRDLRRYGSAEIDLALTGEGSFDAYWELDLQAYDVAAGAVIVREAGGRVTDLDGGDEWLFGGSILASNGAVHDRLLSLVGNAAQRSR